MDLNGFVQNAVVTLVAAAWKIAGALALWLVGRYLIKFVLNVLGRQLASYSVDQTLTRYMQTGLSVLLNVALAALIAAGGVAIGVAWGGLLANFAAGAFLVFLRPFKVGDVVTAGGVTGRVTEVGLFGTIIDTPDNIRTIIGNNKIFSDTIQNFSANPYRRVDLTTLISSAVDHHDAIRLLKERLVRIPNVIETPAPVVDVLQFTPAGPLLCVRPFCSNENYWQVYFDTNRMIREAFGAAGYPAPMPTYAVSGMPVSPAAV
jgi:small conductance mechanosensitive channel